MAVSVNARSRSVLRSRRPQTRLEASCTRTGRSRGCLVGMRTSGRRGEGDSHTARVHAAEESDSGVVLMKRLNHVGTPAAEGAEGRPLIEENTRQASTHPTQSGARVSQGLRGVRKAAREKKERKFTALLHHVTMDRLRESFSALKRKAAPGIDGVMWQEYETGLEDRIIDLHGRVHRGAFRAKPSRRVYIPKADGRQRPLGVAALEDRIVQQAVVAILNQIYEEDFRGFSYGFRGAASTKRWAP
jgi:RNA-directed DNA polymerase